MLPWCIDRQRGMVSREYWGESLPESVQVVKETKSWWACFRLSDSGEWHFPLYSVLSTVRTLTFSCHVMLRWWMGHCDDGCEYLVRSNALNTEREVHKTLLSTVHDGMIIQIFILLMKSNSIMPWNGRQVVYFSVNFKSYNLPVPGCLLIHMMTFLQLFLLQSGWFLPYPAKNHTLNTIHYQFLIFWDRYFSLHVHN